MVVVRGSGAFFVLSLLYHHRHAGQCNDITLYVCYVCYIFVMSFRKPSLGSSILQHHLCTVLKFAWRASEVFNTDTHRTRGWYSDREMMQSALIDNRQQQETGRRERDTQTEGSSLFVLLLYRIPFSPLTLLGLTALCRFSIHLSLSAAERHAKHLVPDAVVT